MDLSGLAIEDHQPSGAGESTKHLAKGGGGGWLGSGVLGAGGDEPAPALCLWIGDAVCADHEVKLSPA